MKKTLTAMALAAGVGTQLFAQLNKEDIITFALTSQSQTSVSTTTAIDAGNWSDLPTHYKTGTKKITQTQILQAIAYVLHGNANWYSSKAQLVLVQGELSGFLAMDLDLARSYAEHNNDDISELDGYYGFIYNMFDNRTDLPNATDTLFAQLPNGRHFGQVPEVWYNWNNLNAAPTDVPTDFVGKYPTGHQQPWGQIFVKDPANTHVSGITADNPWCENVTYFFAITVQECYDCFYLNSFISDSLFQFKGTASPVPCCGGTEVMLGKGTDKYYMTLSFDNTVNNPYLNYDLAYFITDNRSFDVADTLYVDPYNDGDVDGIAPGFNSPFPWVLWYEGVYPDALPYFDPIKSGAVAAAEPYLMRFTLNGIMTYAWTLGFINKSDLNPDFVGTGNYVCNGYGYIALSCALLDGSVKFSEKAVRTACCLDDDSWYDNWYGIGYYPIEHVDNEDSSYYPDSEWSNLWMDGVGYYQPSAPGYYDVDESLPGYAGITPFNTEASLSYHANFDESYEPWTTKGFIEWIRYFVHGDHWY